MATASRDAGPSALRRSPATPPPTATVAAARTFLKSNLLRRWAYYPPYLEEQDSQVEQLNQTPIVGQFNNTLSLFLLLIQDH